ncbi:hypothetical protein D3C75_1043250 [compost metagenome]
MDARQRVRAAGGLLVMVVALQRRLVFALLHDIGLAGERAHQQLADGIEQPGRRVDELQWYGQQVVAQCQDRVRMPGGEGAGQVVGEDQQQRARAETGQPRAVFGPGENRQQGTNDQYQGAAQGIAKNQADEGETQPGQRLVACTRGCALGQQMLLRGFYGSKQA